MNKDKLNKLKKYQAELQDKLADKNIPAKHVNRVDSYRAFLRNELRMVMLTIEAGKLEVSGK